MRNDITVINEHYDGFNPVCFGFENCRPSHSFGPAVRTYWLIHYIVSGSGLYRIGDKEYTISPGEMFVIPPFTETYYQADGEKPWDYIWIGFTVSELPLKLNDVIFCPQASDVFHSMKYCERLENGRSAFLTSKIWELFSLLLNTKKENADYVDKALNLIHSEYMMDIDISYIADKLNLDRSYFSVLFKNKTGVSPGKYLLNYRMNIAASLKVNNQTSVTLTASSVGYNDIFNFSKMFKRHYGMSPRDYIKNHCPDVH